MIACRRFDMDEIKIFLDECRHDQWFRDHPELLDRLEAMLTKFFLVSGGPEWQSTWDRGFRTP
jgi:hypothetical protein